MSRAPEQEGLLLVDKPAGPTSHDVVRWVRRALHTRRVGHAGTLDPFATGLLACLVGRATRLARYLSVSDKTYSGVVQLGWATDTGNPTGEPLAERVEPLVTDAQLDEAVRALSGDLKQTPPMYSAKKRDGRKLYELARRGEVVERPPQDIHVRQWHVERLDPGRVRFAVTVSAGTYVRVLAEDLGRFVGCPAHLAELRRTAAGDYAVDDAVSGERLDDEAEAGLVPLERLRLPMPDVHVGEAAALALRHGRVLEPADWPRGEVTGEPDVVAVRGGGAELLAVARLRDGRLEPETVLCAA